MNPADLPPELAAQPANLIDAVRAITQGPLASQAYAIDRGAYPVDLMKQLAAAGAMSAHLPQPDGTPGDWRTVLDVAAYGKAQGKPYSLNWGYASSCLPPAYERCLLAFSDGGSDEVALREFDLKTAAFVVGGFSSPAARVQSAWLTKDSVLIAHTIGAWSPESEVADILRQTEAAHATCQIGSYPFFREGRVGANFVVRSVSAEDLKACCDSLSEGLAAAGHGVTPGGI